MESINDRFKDLSFDAGPFTPKEHKNIVIFFDHDIIPKIEHRFEDYEKVSFSFLFFDDVQSCINICEKCVQNRDYNFMSDNALDKYSNWDKKFIECIFYVQDILLLVKLGIGIYDAQRVFKRPKYVSKQRLLLYKICENLSNEETLQLMKSMPSLSIEKHLEIFILKLFSLSNGLNDFISSLSLLKKPVINSLIEELNEDSCFKNCFEVIEPSKPLPVSMNVSEDEIYPIKDPENVGLCFILNEVNIKGHLKRDGSSVDVSLLMSTMEYFNIEVKVFNDEPAKFFDVLSKLIDIHFKEKNYSVFFLIIMSHGVPDAILSSDAKYIPINFINIKLSCKSLLKIPKVLIIQACQGEYILLEDLATDGPTSLQFDQAPEVRSKCTTYISDSVTVMSTVKGFKAFRHPTEGTWFIRALCKCMKDYENECILSIITKTIREVKTQYKTFVGDKYCAIQQPEVRSLLEKKLYLKPVANN